MKTDKEFEVYIAQKKILDTKRKEVEKERQQRIISAVNLMTKLSNDFLDFLESNKNRIIGKKCVNNDGISKYFSEIFKEFVWKTNDSPLDNFYIQQSNLKMRANINGGKYQPENTHYCDYIYQTMYDVISCDVKGICLAIREEGSGYPLYEYQEMEFSKVMINNYRKEIEVLKDKIKQEEQSIPEYLRETKHYYENNN